MHGLEDKYEGVVPFSFLNIDDPGTTEIQNAIGYARQWRPFIVILGPDGEVLTDPQGEPYRWIGVIPGEWVDDALIEVLSRGG
ncbi:MAG: hypothetical protein HND51_14370 [Chloroflexi bacterium]|nr:hypothetical protein [Chloroflexota bacterium]